MFEPRQGPDVLACPLDLDLVLSRPSGQSFILNPTAAQIWAMCGGAHGPAAIATELAAAHRLDALRAFDDVMLCLGELQEAGLLGSGGGAAE